MGEQKSITVTIYGHQYKLRGPQDSEHIITLSAELDERMSQIATMSPALATHQVAVLAALRILDELHELQKEYDKGFQLAIFNGKKTDLDSQSNKHKEKGKR